MTAAKGKKIVGLIGDPVEHSISPPMHNAAFQHLDLNYQYVLMPTKAHDLKSRLEELRKKDHAGANVTIPYKEKVIPYLDHIDKTAKIIGAVNTIKNKSGKLTGYNTDAQGFIEALKKEGHYNAHGKTALIIGAGGAARAITVALGHARVGPTHIFDIDTEKVKHLVEHLEKHFHHKFHPIAEIQMAHLISHIQLVINATPIGMHPHIYQSPLRKDLLHKNLFVYDIVYNPTETKLLREAKEAGAKTLNGLPMLVHQGAAAFKIFTGKNAPYEVMLQAAKKALP